MFKFQKLEVWRKSIEFCDRILLLVEKIPRNYQYSLGDQLKRAAISIPTNIAEGCGRRTKKDSANFFNIAKGSTYEVISLLAVASKRELLSGKLARKGIYHQAEEISKMLSGLIKRR